MFICTARGVAPASGALTDRPARPDPPGSSRPDRPGPARLVTPPHPLCDFTGYPMAQILTPKAYRLWGARNLSVTSPLKCLNVVDSADMKLVSVVVINRHGLADVSRARSWIATTRARNRHHFREIILAVIAD